MRALPLIALSGVFAVMACSGDTGPDPAVLEAAELSAVCNGVLAEDDIMTQMFSSAGTSVEGFCACLDETIGDDEEKKLATLRVLGTVAERRAETSTSFQDSIASLEETSLEVDSRLPFTSSEFHAVGALFENVVQGMARLGGGCPALALAEDGYGS